MAVLRKKLCFNGETNVFHKFPLSFRYWVNEKRFADVFGRRRLKMLQNVSFHKERYFEAEHNVFCKFAMSVQYLWNEEPF